MICLNCGVWKQVSDETPCSECGFDKYQSGNVRVLK